MVTRLQEAALTVRQPATTRCCLQSNIQVLRQQWQRCLRLRGQLRWVRLRHRGCSVALRLHHTLARVRLQCRLHGCQMLLPHLLPLLLSRPWPLPWLMEPPVWMCLMQSVQHSPVFASLQQT
jgi:hypothetical protein